MLRKEKSALDACQLALRFKRLNGPTHGFPGARPSLVRRLLFELTFGQAGALREVQAVPDGPLPATEGRLERLARVCVDRATSDWYGHCRGDVVEILVHAQVHAD